MHVTRDELSVVDLFSGCSENLLRKVLPHVSGMSDVGFEEEPGFNQRGEGSEQTRESETSSLLSSCRLRL